MKRFFSCCYKETTGLSQKMRLLKLPGYANSLPLLGVGRAYRNPVVCI